MSLPSLQEFEQILRNILSPNNTLRNQAEEYFNKTKSQPDYCIGSLIRVLRTSQEQEIRGLACVLLKKCLSDSDAENSFFSLLSPNMKATVKNELTTALAEEKLEHIRHKLVYAVTNFVAPWIEKKEYPDFIPTMFEWAKSNSPTHRESALTVFNQLATHLMNKGLEPYIPQLKEILTACLNDSSNTKVRLAALEATSSVVLVVEKNNRAKFQDLIPHMLSVLAKALNSSDTNSAQSVIEALIEIAVSHASFFKNHLPAVISAMYQIAKTKQLDDSIRHLAMEFMVSMAENASQVMKKIPTFVDNLFPLCMEMMLDLEEDEDWANTYEDEDLELTNYDVGLESLDRLAIALGGKHVQPIAFKIIPQYLNNQNWKHRMAGLMAIAQTAEGCQEEYQAHLNTLVTMALKLFKDAHPRVRYAAIHCTAQLSTDFAGSIQSKYHSQIVPALMYAMEDQVPRVQSHAATAVVNFVEDCEKQYIEPHLDNLLSKLLQLLKGGRRFVQEQSLSAISAIADCAEKLFIKYYDAIMPFLKQILLKATGKQERMLRARAIECVSLVGVAVGKQKFGVDAKEVMELLHRTQQAPLEPDDPQIHHLLQAWTRIAKCLGEDFLPYLSYVMPPLLKAAEQQPQVVVSDADDENPQEEEGMESVTLSIKGVGDKRISIRTSALEEKALACSMLFSYVLELKDGFCPWVEQVAKIMVPLLKFPYLEEIRETASQIMPQLVKSVKLAAEKGKADNKMAKQLFDFILKTLLEALKIEPEVKTAAVLAESLKESVASIGNDLLSAEQLEQITALIKTLLLDSLQRKQQIEKEVDEEEDDEEVDRLDEEAVYEDEFLTMIVELIGVMLKTNQAFITNFIQQLWPIYAKMLDPKLSVDEHRMALCVICDFIEHGKQSYVQFANETVPALLNYAGDSSAEVRQAAVYGLGSLAQFGGQPFVSVALEVLQKLKAVITAKDAKEEQNAAATANAVSALYKIIQFRSDVVQSKNINPNDLLQFWLQALPVSGDNIEARIVHGNLLELIQKNNTVILGNNNANIPVIIKIFAQILDTELVSEEQQTKVVQILATMQQQLPAQFLKQAWEQLSQEEQKKIQANMGKASAKK